MPDLNTPEIDRLLSRLDELVRWRPGGKGEYFDPHGLLQRVTGSANHVILGRRGSGKTRLLDELSRSAAEDTTVISVGAEDFKGLSYPDVLIQVLDSFLTSFEKRLSAKPELLSGSWWRGGWKRLRHPLLSSRTRRERRDLLTSVTDLRRELAGLYSESSSREAEYVQVDRQTESDTQGRAVSAGGAVGDAKLSSGSAKEAASETKTRTTQTEQKHEKVQRLLPQFKTLLGNVSTHLDSRIVLAVDDFYFLRREDQPAVVDYIHLICKDTRAFLKIATIKHRSRLYQGGEVVLGVVPGHEVQTIDLELSLGQLDPVARFLEAVWKNVCDEEGVAAAADIFRGQGFHQLVLSSGGVPRDFFGIAKSAISIARERGEATVGKLRVNEAAREYAERTKFPEVELDAAVAESERSILLFDIVRFARDEKRRNCFHVDLDQLAANPDVQWLLDALVDARLLHLVSDNTSNARRAGRYAAYLLDVGLYGHPQRRGDRAISEVEFWDRDEGGRLQNLARAPVYPVRSIEDLREAAATVPDAEVVDRILNPVLEEDEGPATVGQIDIVFPSLADREQEGS